MMFSNTQPCIFFVLRFFGQADLMIAFERPERKLADNFYIQTSNITPYTSIACTSVLLFAKLNLVPLVHMPYCLIPL